MSDSVVLDSSVIAVIFFFKDSNSDAAASAIADKRLITLDLSMAEVLPAHLFCDIAINQSGVLPRNLFQSL